MFLEEKVNIKEVRNLTNEEQRVNGYGKNLCTDSSKVNMRTPLKTLNLNWTEKELPEKIRTKHVHRLHPYLGKYIPQLVEVFLRKYFKKGDTVLDPFCGSGTTLVQANELNIHSIGFDISEFNILLSKVKTAEYDIALLRKETLDLLNRVERLIVNGTIQRNLFEQASTQTTEIDSQDEYLNRWFHPNALKELLIYRQFLKGYKYQDFLKVVLSRSARSSRLTTHYDLDFPKYPQIEPYHCYKHNRICQPTSDAYKFLKRYSLDGLERVTQFSFLRTKAKVELFHTDSRKAKPPKIDGIITSPPYVGLIDYHEQHRYAYQLLELTDNSNSEIGPAQNGSSKRAQEEYKKSIAEVFINASKKLKKGGKIIIIAGDRNNLYPQIAELANLKLQKEVVRHVNRRTGRRSTEFYESIFIYSKSD